MKWTSVPTLDQALRAYIIKSRIRDGDKLLLAQPYSPMLFRQGVQPGPKLLLDTLRKEITPKEAKKKWSEFDAEQKEAAKHGNFVISGKTRLCSLVGLALRRFARKS